MYALNTGFYNGAELLSRRDINGNIPIIFISDLTRSRGKTTYFKKLSINKGKKTSFVTLIYRSRIDLINAGNDLCEFVKMWYPGSTVDYFFKHNDYIGRLIVDDKFTIATVALRYSKALKNFGAVLSQTSAFFFDELQPEDGVYLPDEYAKFQSIYQTAAREKGNRYRPVPVYVATNPYTLFNPYYQAWGIVEKVNLTSRFVCGDGWVLEQYEDKEYTSAVENDPIISGNGIKYGKESIYLNEAKCVIKKLPQGSNYLVNVTKDDTTIGIVQLKDGNIWLTNQPDTTRKTVLLYDGISSNTLHLLRQYVKRGAVRFKNLQTRGALSKIL